MEELDFENFKVDKERAENIRNHVGLLKGDDLVGDLHSVCHELGFEYIDDSGQQNMPGMGKGLKEQIFEICDCSSQAEIRLEITANDLKVRYNQKLACEVSFLPKDKDFVVAFVDNDAWATLTANEDSVLNNLVNTARKKKAERQKLWKARFNKNKDN